MLQLMAEVYTGCATTKGKRKSKYDWAKIAALRASRLTWNEVAAEVGAPSGLTLQVLANQNGLNKVISHQQNRQAEKVARVIDETLAARSERVRSQFAAALERGAVAVSQLPVEPTGDSLEQLGRVLEPLARVSDKVFGWGEQSTGGVVCFAVLQAAGTSAEEVNQKIIDVQALQSCGSSPATPESPSCGVDTPIGGVPAERAEEQRPQSAQVVDSQADASASD